MYESTLKTVKSSFQPLVQWAELNRKTLEKITSVQTSYLTDCISSSIKQAKSLAEAGNAQRATELTFEAAKEFEAKLTGLTEQNLSALKELREAMTTLVNDSCSDNYARVTELCNLKDKLGAITATTPAATPATATAAVKKAAVKKTPAVKPSVAPAVTASAKPTPAKPVAETVAKPVAAAPAKPAAKKVAAASTEKKAPVKRAAAKPAAKKATAKTAAKATPAATKPAAAKPAVAPVAKSPAAKAPTATAKSPANKVH